MCLSCVSPAHRSTRADQKKARRVIKKRKKAFTRNARREARKLRSMGVEPLRRRKKLEIPNMCPFKEALLRRAFQQKDEMRAALAEKAARKKAERRARMSRGAEKAEAMGVAVPKSYRKGAFQSAESMRLPESDWEHRAMYMRELAQVIAESDVVVEVLDARDPLGCRSAEVERRVLLSESALFGDSKRLVLLLNKIDLVPCDVLAKWMRVLRRRFPVIAFKASTQSQRRKSQSRMRFQSATLRRKGTTSECVGADALMQLLKNYCRTLDLKAPITVGVCNLMTQHCLNTY